MQFCTDCGKQIEVGSVCECRQSQQMPTQIPQPNQFQQPVQFQQPNQFQQPPPQYPQQPNQFQQPPPQYPQQPGYPYPYGQPKAKLPGQTMIRVSGILLTIFGGIAAPVMVAALDAVDTLGRLVPDSYKTYLGFSALMAIAALVVGIIGIALASKKDKAGLIIGCGVTLIVLRGIDLIWALSAFGNLVEGSTVFFALAGLTLPILYIVGGNKLKSAP